MNEKLLVDFKNVLDEVIQQHPDLERAVGTMATLCVITCGAVCDIFAC